MASTATVSSGGGGKRRRVLSPSEKYEIYVAVLTGQCTQREAVEKWRVDRTTVTTICRLAKAGALEALSARPGQPGMSAEQVELEEVRAEAERLRATVAEQAVTLHLYQGKCVWG
jgi:transposase-like protein